MTPAFARDGAQLFPGAAAGALARVAVALGQVPQQRPGVRLNGNAALDLLLAPEGPIGGIAACVLGGGCRPVRTILFDKNPATNWSLGWHQDRTICVRERADVPGFGPWTVKQGMIHVAPPFALLARMLTLRVHLDAVPADNAPLLIAPGSHLRLVPEAEIETTVARCGQYACLAVAGDVWLYSTPILHASAASRSDGHRRVLQIDYSADALPDGLEWLGV